LLAAAVASLLSTVTLLSGCAVGPRYTRPEVKLNNNWSMQPDTRVASESNPAVTWWKSFNDPTLDRLIEQAFRQNLPLQIAGLRILEARARLGLAIGEQYPQVQVAVGSATAIGLSERAVNSALIDKHYKDFAVGFDAAWEADLWGKYRKGVTAEKSGYFASVADYDNALVSLLAEVARTYAVIRTFEMLIEQARANVGVQEEGLRIADARFRNGATSELDVTQSRTLLESTRTTIPQLQASLQQAENALSTLLGQTTGSLTPLLQTPSQIPLPPAQVSISVPAEMLRRRADIRSAELVAMAQCDRIGIAKADFYPRLTLAGSIGTRVTQHGDVNNSVGDLFSSDSFYYSFGAQLLYPLFNYGRLKNNVRIEDARFQQSLVNYRDTVLRAAQEVEDALAGYLRARDALVSAQSAADAARRSVDLAFVQYREGAVDFQRVLDAQRSLLEEENTLTDVRSSVATNLIALYKALGGGWEIREGQPYVDDSNRKEMEERTDWDKYFSSPEPR
jgi:NodT family efflux transporter outer membrane factor (OMF) lipoprotein